MLFSWVNAHLTPFNINKNYLTPTIYDFILNFAYFSIERWSKAVVLDLFFTMDLEDLSQDLDHNISSKPL